VLTKRLGVTYKSQYRYRSLGDLQAAVLCAREVVALLLARGARRLFAADKAEDAGQYSIAEMIRVGLRLTDNG
jgi:hypothetical protein